MPTYLDSRSGRVKLTNANVMYHSTEKGYFFSTYSLVPRFYILTTIKNNILYTFVVLTSGNTSSSSESIASDPHSFSSDLPVKQKRSSMMSVHYASGYAQRNNPSVSV